MLDEAIKKHPDFAKLWMMRGQIEDQQDNTAAARDVYNRGVSGREREEGGGIELRKRSEKDG